MKRSELKRVAPLKRTAPLAAGPLARSSLHARQPGHHKPTRRPRDTGPTKAVVIAVLERDGYCCFRCGLIAVCGSATSPGGCHLAIESHRTEARDNGWAIRQSEDPLQLPVLHWQYGLIFLHAAGGFGSRPAAASNPIPA